jgi:SAM-dependent methyltransferase
VRERPGQWNHNLHYHPLLLGALGTGRRAALDVGCGDGALTRALAPRVTRATGIDRDAASIATARSLSRHLENVSFVEGDFLAHDFGPERFDVVVSVAALHHMPLEPALEALKRVLRPGGILGIVGLARSRSLKDLGYDAFGALAHRAYRRARGYGQPSSPVAEPTLSYAQVRRATETILPGRRFRRHVLFRYSVVWMKPTGRAQPRQ